MTVKFVLTMMMVTIILMVVVIYLFNPYGSESGVKDISLIPNQCNFIFNDRGRYRINKHCGPDGMVVSRSA